MEVFNNLPKGWENHFNKNRKELEKIFEYLKNDPRGFLPLEKDIFAAFYAVPLDKIKVCLLGQDVYHSYDSDGKPTSVGQAFMTRRGVKIAPSMRNLYIELNRSDPSFIIPQHGDISNWAAQGVFLLNTCLTVAPHEPESHIKVNLWNEFILSVFQEINRVNPRCIYMLLGSKAQAWVPYLGPDTIKLCCSHPSPYSFKATNSPLYGSNIFLYVNAYLNLFGNQPIDWTII